MQALRLNIARSAHDVDVSLFLHRIPYKKLYASTNQTVSPRPRYSLFWNIPPSHHHPNLTFIYTDLTRATQLFSQLASPTGTNNALAQVLYGLSLRHGWGCTPDPDLSLSYLTQAAANAGAIERAALQSGKERGGAAKGELVLAIFELGNSFRYGWGTAHDPVAARSYYECAAELGDVDAMGEAAWCFVDGFGGPKDKFKAAMYLRRAEGKGRVGVGESWYVLLRWVLIPS